MHSHIRPYDPTGKFAGALLRIYPHFNLELSFRQHTLGTGMVFYRGPRPRVQTLTDLEPDEFAEMRRVMSDFQKALKEAFRPDHVNALMLGHEISEFHLHIVPRYRSSRDFDGRVWEDKTFGQFPPWTFHQMSHAEMEKLSAVLLPLLPPERHA